MQELGPNAMGITSIQADSAMFQLQHSQVGLRRGQWSTTSSHHDPWDCRFEKSCYHKEAHEIQYVCVCYPAWAFWRETLHLTFNSCLLFTYHFFSTSAFAPLLFLLNICALCTVSTQCFMVAIAVARRTMFSGCPSVHPPTHPSIRSSHSCEHNTSGMPFGNLGKFCTKFHLDTTFMGLGSVLDLSNSCECHFSWTPDRF